MEVVAANIVPTLVALLAAGPLMRVRKRRIEAVAMRLPGVLLAPWREWSRGVRGLRAGLS